MTDRQAPAPSPDAVRQRHPRARERTRRRTACRGGAGAGCGRCAGGSRKRVRRLGRKGTRGAAARPASARPASARLPCAGLPSAAWERRDHTQPSRPFERECGHGRSLTGDHWQGRLSRSLARGVQGQPPPPTPGPTLHAHERSHAWGTDKASRLMMPSASHLSMHACASALCMHVLTLRLQLRMESGHNAAV
jgi:hypothetical protein